MVWMLQGLQTAVLMDCGVNTVFLGGIELYSFLRRMAALLGDNALVKMCGGKPRFLLLLTGIPSGEIA